MIKKRNWAKAALKAYFFVLAALLTVPVTLALTVLLQTRNRLKQRSSLCRTALIFQKVQRFFACLWLMIGACDV